MDDALTSERITLAADPWVLYEMSMEQGWGDGLPLLPPTEERVRSLLEATPLPAGHTIVEEMHPAGGPATVEKIAVNAAMTGCLPEHLPFVIAGVEAICQPGYNLYGVGATTGNAFQMLMVNGPSRDRVGIDYSYGCMGGATGRGSRTIGRAVALCLRNIGGQRAGTTTKSCFGQPARLGMCFGEWEERSPWPSLAEQRGFDRGQDVVHAHAGMGTMPLCDNRHEDARDLAYLLARSIAYPASNKMLSSIMMARNGSIVLALNPDWADRLGREFPDVEDLKYFLWEHAYQPIDLWPDSTRHLFEERVDGEGKVRVNERPDQFVVIVCGGPVSLHAVALPSWGESLMQSRAVRSAV
ncbi:MAG TPA: hypothetical protein VFH70_04100 [Acidimicrobiales bacterium]|nr:hypothetical protein [Acidimicrobiales bacterium]